MMANKVSRITICGIPYTIAHEKDNFDADLHFGQIDYKTCTIRINDDISEALKIESLCHEMVHAILVHIGRSEMSQDEGFVQSLANAINQSFVPKIKEGDSVDAFKPLPSVQLEIMPDGTLHITATVDVANINRILLSQAGTHLGDLYYKDDE